MLLSVLTRAIIHMNIARLVNSLAVIQPVLLCRILIFLCNTRLCDFVIVDDVIEWFRTPLL